MLRFLALAALCVAPSQAGALSFSHSPNKRATRRGTMKQKRRARKMRNAEGKTEKAQSTVGSRSDWWSRVPSRAEWWNLVSPRSDCCNKLTRCLKMLGVVYAMLAVRDIAKPGGVDDVTSRELYHEKLSPQRMDAVLDSARAAHCVTPVGLPSWVDTNLVCERALATAASGHRYESRMAARAGQSLIRQGQLAVRDHIQHETGFGNDEKRMQVLYERYNKKAYNGKPDSLKKGNIAVLRSRFLHRGARERDNDDDVEQAVVKVMDVRRESVNGGSADVSFETAAEGKNEFSVSIDDLYKPSELDIYTYIIDSSSRTNGDVDAHVAEKAAGAQGSQYKMETAASYATLGLDVPVKQYLKL